MTPTSRSISASYTEVGSSNVSWIDDGWTLTKTYHVIGFAPRPSLKVMDSIVVRWEPPTLDPLGNFCTMRGQLLYTPDAENEPQPVDWFQGITLYVDSFPDSRLDWMAGTKRDSSIERTQILSTLGQFEMTFDLRDREDDRALAESYQFGIALATHEINRTIRHTVNWTSQAPVLTGSLEMLEIPAAPVLSHELELINRAATRSTYSGFNGVQLIRAVNALQQLSKDEVLITLEEYLSKITLFEYMGEEKVVFWIIHLLFEPMVEGERLPDGTGVGFADSEVWPLDPLVLSNDVPFNLGYESFIQGTYPNPITHIEWARQHGVIRDKPLMPTTNPLLAADTILRSSQFSQVDEFNRDNGTRQAKEQAMAMVESLIPPITAGPYDDVEQERQWQERVALSIELGVTWDPVRQEFVIPTSE